MLEYQSYKYIHKKINPLIYYKIIMFQSCINSIHTHSFSIEEFVTSLPLCLLQLTFTLFCLSISNFGGGISPIRSCGFVHWLDTLRGWVFTVKQDPLRDGFETSCIRAECADFYVILSESSRCQCWYEPFLYQKKTSWSQFGFQRSILPFLPLFM